MSVVAKDENGRPFGAGPEAIVSVRFRRKRDAAALFRGYAVTSTPKGDFGFRVFATRAEVAEVLVHEALGLDYGNFKGSIPANDEPPHDACMSAWSVFGRLQRGSPTDSIIPRGPASKPQSKAARKAVARWRCSTRTPSPSRARRRSPRSGSTPRCRAIRGRC